MDREYKWVIPKFSEQTQRLQSNEFSGPTEDTKWFMRLHPNGNNEFKNFLCAFLHLKESPKEIYATPEFRILNRFSLEKSVVKKLDFVIFAKDEVGFSAYGGKIVASSEISEASGFLVNDTLTITCKLNILVQEQNHDGLLSNIEKMFELKEFTDCVLVCPDGEVPASKFILASQSDVFRTMFTTDTVEAKTGRVQIDDCDSEVMREVYRFTCCGKVEKLDELVEGLLCAADKYGIEKLKNICIANMSKSLSKDNVCKRLIIADRQNVYFVKRAALKFIVKYRKDLTELADYDKLISTENRDLIVDIFAKCE